MNLQIFRQKNAEKILACLHSHGWSSMEFCDWSRGRVCRPAFRRGDAGTAGSCWSGMQDGSKYVASRTDDMLCTGLKICSVPPKAGDKKRWRAGSGGITGEMAIFAGDECTGFVFGTGAPDGAIRRGCPHARGRAPGLRRQRLVHAARGGARRAGARPEDAAARAAGRMAGALPCRRRAAPRAGGHGRQYPAGRVLRPAVRGGRGASLPGQALVEGPGADGVCAGAAARDRPGCGAVVLRRG